MDLLENESDILLSVSRTEQEAFRLLVVHYRPVLLSYIFSFTRSRERAEELVQDVFVQVWSARATLPDIKNFKGFLYVISRNLALNAVRDNMREKLRIKKWSEENPQETVTNPELLKDEAGILDEAIAQLPPQQQKVWLATRKEGKKLAEVASEMNLSITSIKKYVQLANRSITAFIIKRGDLMLLISLFWKK